MTAERRLARRNRRRTSTPAGSATVDVTVESGYSATVHDKAGGATASYSPASKIGGKIGNLHGLDLTLVPPPAAPEFAPKSGTVFFCDAQTVAISCAGAGARIRYTLDGSEPAAESALYEGPLSISKSTTVRARAFKDGADPGEIASATYSRRAIVAENLVRNAAPPQGETQTLHIPAAGGYAVSFDYEGVRGRYGENVELRLAKDGAEATLASVAAPSAGTFSTNFTFAIAQAGEYGLCVHNPRAGTEQPVAISNLSIAIPAADARKYWICETERTKGSTGAWSANCAFKDGKMALDGEIGLFTPDKRQDARRYTITFTTSFDALSQDVFAGGDVPKAGIQIMPDANGGGNTFALLTSAGGAPVWRPVRAAGGGAPALNTPYTFKFDLDCTNKTYSAYLAEDGALSRLCDGDVDAFAFAGGGSEGVRAVSFEGSGSVETLFGSYGALAFAAGDRMAFADGTAATPVTQGQADWLNAMGDSDAVLAKVATMREGEFSDAWLLNLDLAHEGSRLVEFKVSRIETTDTEVRISVKLERDGALGGAINGTLLLFGGATPGAAAPEPANLLDATPIGNADFGDGDTAVFVYPRGGGAKFFLPAIR